MEEQNEEIASSGKDKEFKKPVLIEKVGHLPKKVKNVAIEENLSDAEVSKSNDSENQELTSSVEIRAPAQQLADNDIPIPYKEPVWSGLPKSSGQNYSFEILKNGRIIETFDLMEKPFWVFGRMNNCDHAMQHPTISRFHAVLQYRDKADGEEQCGFYVYDLSSTHGTFLNKNRLRPRVYSRIRVGHMLKLGCSSRGFILTGPEEDQEAESEFSVAELREKRAQEIEEREEAERNAILKMQQAEEEKKKKEEERGVDWGMGDDADEETDLSENPFAQTNNEELYLDDPKKTLRGFFEREGLNLDYDCSEQGMGQFLCKVELPVDDDRGRPIFAEVLHKGKKKEAVVQCALEACRILDRYGMLRQAVHESRKRKVKDWAENDYYDSDDDTFLDRTGDIEKKREKRMNSKLPQKAETYDSLLEKEKTLRDKIKATELQLKQAQEKIKADQNSNKDEDSLEAFMKDLKDTKPDKHTINQLKSDLTKLKLDHAQVIKLANVAKPASLPSLVAHYSSEESSSGNPSTSNKLLPVFGKRRKVKISFPAKPSGGENLPSTSRCHDVEMDEEEDEIEEKEDRVEKVGDLKETSEVDDKNDEVETSVDDMEVDEKVGTRKEEEKSDCDKKLENSMPSTSANGEGDNIAELLSFKDEVINMMATLSEQIETRLKNVSVEEDRMHWDWKLILAKKRKLYMTVADLREAPNERLKLMVTTELRNIIKELGNIINKKCELIETVQKMRLDIVKCTNFLQQALEKLQYVKERLNSMDSIGSVRSIENQVEEEQIAHGRTKTNEEDDISSSNQLGDQKNDKNELGNGNNEVSTSNSKDVAQPGTSNVEDDRASNVVSSSSVGCEDGAHRDDDSRKKKKNQRRIQQRQEKVDVEKQKGYEEDSMREDYSMWVPPKDQTGDGTTDLNKKYGY